MPKPRLINVCFLLKDRRDRQSAFSYIGLHESGQAAIDAARLGCAALYPGLSIVPESVSSAVVRDDMVRQAYKEL